ncbi:hypothetical protein PLEOSDRAFT_1061778 [Pleurotus ostreatus PC15]|uniref:Saccharopine dehydrogenase NADP binding domain-containing protein n=1 Tax=Pleurotus ostreatus (strain PC15) TaxID=1137138 RepID=A0A067P5F2_PLEO1|nr:hypothetical protein PLEOSDRAFT_1061778 [Pleurotus ostreatus PC15]
MAGYDLLVLGATGFTGKLITRYLYAHPQHKNREFTFAIAGRSLSKLTALAKSIDLDTSLVPSVLVDVTNAEDVERAVKSAKVVINTVGPYWTWGTPVVRACVRHGVHYVDLTGEPPWVRDIIYEFDYAATRTGAIIVPSCGMDSIPSDYSVYLSYKHLGSLDQIHGWEMLDSTTAYNLRGGVSGGTISTGLTMLENVPQEKMKESFKPYGLSPVKGPRIAPRRLVYTMPHIPRLVGAFFFMAPANRALVQRTWGLLEMVSLQSSPSPSSSPSSTPSINGITTGKVVRYGPNFTYDEFLQMPSKMSAFTLSVGMMAVAACLVALKPVRWLFKRLVTQPGEGPSEETMQNGYIRVTNVTTAVPAFASPPTASASTPTTNGNIEPTVVKSQFIGQGCPGYLLTSIMISESALSILLMRDRLPALAQRGGVLTPVTAFGDVLVERLERTGRFEFRSEVLDAKSGEDRKRR